MSEPWFSPQQAGLVGGLVGSGVGVWGAMVGVLSGLLIPRCRGRGWLLGLLWAGAATGLALTATAVVAAVDGQPFHVLHALGLPGVMLQFFGFGGAVLTRHRCRAAEEQRMARQDAV